MNTRSMARLAAGIAAAGLAIGALAACTGGSSPEPTGTGDAPEAVTITWWHNQTGEPANGFWRGIAAEFEAAHPGVTVEVTAYQNEDLQGTLIPNALRSNNPPDLYQQWGAGELAAQVAAGYVKDISSQVTAEVDAIGGTVAPWQVDGKTYGLPFTFGISGFWYNTELFAQAGITEPPTTLDALYDAIAKLKAAGITPIAVGAGDGWPAGHYWMHFAIKLCSPAVLSKAQSELVFEDACFIKAGEMLQEFLASKPFQEGYLATPAQQGAGSSAGLLANGQAAMELMGHWNPAVMGGLTPDQKVPSFLGWFNFPGIPGAPGDPTAALGGGDGFSVSANAPDITVELLKYIVSADVQKRYATTVETIPVTKGAEAGVSDANLLKVIDGLQASNYVQLWMDVAYGPNVGGAMTDGIARVFAGQGSPQEIVDGMKTAAANR